MGKKIQEISALTRTYNLLLWIIPVLEKFPRNQKFLLGDRIESLLLDIMELTIQAVYSKDKVSFLKDTNLKIEILRHLIRLSKDLKHMNIKKYKYASKCVNEIGSEIGGWLKYSQTHRGSQQIATDFK